MYTLHGREVCTYELFISKILLFLLQIKFTDGLH